MTPEQVLSHPPRVLSQKQREFYFGEGYLLLEKIIPQEWIERLRAATDELVERSRKVSKSDAVWDLEPGHRAAGQLLGYRCCRHGWPDAAGILARLSA
jgi:ectoine hydroxylase